MGKLLYIAHYFPPIGGAGVQRTVKFVKHLGGCGWVPVVVTGKVVAKTRWTPDDESLQAELPGGLVVGRAEWDGGQSRDQNRQRRHEAYVDQGSRLIRENGVELIFVTMSPFGDARIAAELSEQHGIPWVADLRDPWALDEFQEWPSRWHRARTRREMGESLSTAARIIMNTPEAARRLAEAFPDLSGRAGPFITNGYDAEDFAGPAPGVKSEVFTLVHSGYLHTDAGLRQRRHRWRNRLLGRLEAGVETLSRSHYYLVQAVNRWLASDPGVRGRFRMQFIGVPTAVDQEVVERAGLQDLVEFTGYLPHDECVRRTRGADLLFLPMHHLPAGRRASIVPGKAYEYMATGRPIFAAVPEGDAKDFLQTAGTARIVAPTDVEGMRRALGEAFSDWQAGSTIAERWRPEAVSRFERKALTRQLADVLEAVVAEGEVSLGVAAQQR